MYGVVLLTALTTGSATPNWQGYDGDCYSCFGGFFDDGYGGYGGGFSDGGDGHGYGGGYSWGYGDLPHPGTVVPGGYGVTDGTVVPGTGINFGGYSAGDDGYGYGIGYGWDYGDVSPPGNFVPGVYGMTGGTVVPGMGTSNKKLSKPKLNKNDDKETMAPTRATLVVELPANATLFIDNLPVRATARVQTFNTQALEAGQAYFYLVRVERSRDGQPVSETRRIIVRAGQVSRADLNNVASEEVTTTQAK